ncbi:MAG: biopolymer transporter ExbD [Candidatus Cloacimonetes bacterium]|nr:biopolymer transporter ExbD [Candidatus Cloacimonadota bacterium]
MAFGASKRRIQKSSHLQEINLIPIMNLFITIIPMLLMITVTVHMALLSLNLTASGMSGTGEGSGVSGTGDKVKEIKLVLYVDRFELFEEGNVEPIVIPAGIFEDGELRHDYRALDLFIEDIKNRNMDINEIRIAPYPDVYYGTLIRAIDICKLRGFPEVKYERIRVGTI